MLYGAGKQRKFMEEVVFQNILLSVCEMPGIVSIYASHILFNSRNKYMKYPYVYFTEDEIEV